jgi:small subunit ribosomal protein S16
MPVRIRLSRVGKKHAPFYRVVSVDGRKKRDGAYLEDIGTYDAIKGVVVRFDEETYERRIKQGAVPSDSVKKIFSQFKGLSAKPTPVVAKKVAVKKTAVVKEESVSSNE